MRVLKFAGVSVLALGVALAATVGVGSYLTERDIEAFQARVAAIAEQSTVSAFDAADLETLPAPVRRYLTFAFPDGVPDARVVRLSAEGEFRRPLTEGFSFTTAEQVIAIREPALMFSATTPVLPGVWARAYDFFADGQMEMKAKIVAVLTVVDEKETPELNVISLRRWLLESALFPRALLPGGPVTWEPIDQESARAVVAADGMRATMVAHFDETGRITFMVAEEDGDLTTPYHGSGEHVMRDDYRLVDGMMIPHSFTISRAADGEIHPFFIARITSIAFE